MNVPPEDLTPLELATQKDGMALLAKVQELKKEAGESVILGEDGRPINMERSIEPPGEGNQSLKVVKATRERIEHNAKCLNTIVSANPHAAKCAVTIHAGWQLLYWTMNDLLTIEGMTDELVQQLSDHLRTSAMSKGFDVGELLTKIRTSCVPFIQERVSYYAQEKRKRDVKIKEIERRTGKKGIALPCQSLRSLFEEGTPFNIGGMLVLHGKPDAVRAVLKLCVQHHMKENLGHPFYLSAEEKPTQPTNLTVMPLKWWAGKARAIVELEETLQPVVDKPHAILLVVEDANKLWEVDDRDRAKEHLKVKATARLYQWAYTNQVAVIMGDSSESLDEKIYGELPCCKVALAELDGKQHVVIGNDTLALDLENLE